MKHALWLLFLAGTSLAAGDKDAATLVREGCALFRAGKFREAAARFAQAEVEAPEDPWIAFNRGVALLAQGEADKARSFLEKAARTRERELRVRALYNLGALEVIRLRALVGQDPAAVPPARRGAVGEAVTDAVAAFRAVLEEAPEDRGAREALEGLRLWWKHIQDLWRRRDREKARRETPLLPYLEALIGEQRAVVAGLDQLLEPGPDPAAQGTGRLTLARIERELAQEMPHLEKKLADALRQGGGGKGGAPEVPPRLKEQIGKARRHLDGAAAALEAGKVEGGLGEAEGALAALEALWLELADFQSLLRRALGTQEGLVGRTAAAAAGELRGERPLGRLAPEEERVERWAGAMAERLPAPRRGKGGAQDAERLKKARALLREARQALARGSAALRARHWQKALPFAEEALAKLRELAKLWQKKTKTGQAGGAEGSQGERPDKKQPEKREQAKGAGGERREPAALTRVQAERLLRRFLEARRKRESRRFRARTLARPHVEKDW